MHLQSPLENRRIGLSQGRALGGSSAINAHVFVPPSKTTINAWEKLGNSGWNWDVLKPYYTKAHSLRVQQPALNEHLGINWVSDSETAPSGPIQTSYVGTQEDPIPKAWQDTFKSLGLHVTQDPFSGEAMGAFSCLASVDQDTKERSYAATAYYVPASQRSNLKLRTGLTVDKIIFDDAEKPCAIGVQYSLDDKQVTVKARKEVILAAGTIQSPKILEVSGIGASELLKSHGMKVRVDNPKVGENLQDHLVCGIAFEAKDNVPTLDDLVRQDPKAIESAMQQYMTTKTGPLITIGLSSYAYLPVFDLLHQKDRLALQTLLDSHAPAAKQATSSSELYYGISRALLESKDQGCSSFLTVACQTVPPVDPDSTVAPTAPLPGKFITIGAMLSQPFSRGSVHITSSDAKLAPAVDPKYLSHPLDLEVFARYAQYIEVIAATEPFKSLLKENRRHADPDSYLEELDAAKAYVQKTAISMWHPTSTCNMMPRDRGGVVDERLRVHGTTNLRVVDASVIPLIPIANCQSTVYALAERAADLIKADHGLTTG